MKCIITAVQHPTKAAICYAMLYTCDELSYTAAAARYAHGHITNVLLEPYVHLYLADDTVL
jgi:hypothetical protein